MALIMAHYTVYILLIFLMILLSFVFSGTETALLSSSRLRLEGKAREGHRMASRALYILDNLEDALGMTLIGNNIVNISASAFITYIATMAFMAGERRLLEVTAVETIAFLILCEVVPKVVARAKAETFLMFMSYPLTALMLVMKPLVKFSLAFSSLLKKTLNLQEADRGIVRSREEIDTMFKIGEEEGVIDREHLSYVSEILSFKYMTAGEIMTPTIDIISVDLNGAIRTLVATYVRTKFSRIPVFDSRVDNIVGYVFYRDLVKQGNVRKIADVMNRAHYVPRTKRIVDLYNEMVDNLIPMVFVVNEYGAVVGMVTHEDIAEEVVGEIHMRDQSEEELLSEIGKERYLLSGRIDIEYFMRRFRVYIEKKDFETLSGFIEYKMGRIPRKGDRLKHEGHTFIIEEATGRSIEKVILQLRKRKKRIIGPS
ncbi:MAG: HlyC/CorC family transporter [Spirochaetes bacterium]|nr:HlyC/CorC family transporter [Spirochaetota bacterium]